MTSVSYFTYKATLPSQTATTSSVSETKVNESGVESINLPFSQEVSEIKKLKIQKN